MEDELYSIRYYIDSSQLGVVSLRMTISAPVLNAKNDRWDVTWRIYINDELECTRTASATQSFSALCAAMSHVRLELEHVLTNHDSPLFGNLEEVGQFGLPLDMVFQDRDMLGADIPRNPLLYTRDLSDL